MSSFIFTHNGPILNRDSASQTKSRVYFTAVKSEFFTNLRLKNKYTNINIEVDNCTFETHVELLSAASEFFDAIVRHDGLSSGQTKIQNVDLASFSLLVDFVYTGCLNTTIDKIPGVYIAADYLALGHAVDICRERLKAMLAEDKAALILVSEIATNFNDTCLVHALYEFIGRNPFTNTGIH